MKTLYFLHAGTYRNEQICIEDSLSNIGASSGDVAEKVIIEQARDSCLVYREDSGPGYLGYVTQRSCPLRGSESGLRQAYCALKIEKNCWPTVEECIIRSSDR